MRLDVKVHKLCDKLADLFNDKTIASKSYAYKVKEVVDLFLNIYIKPDISKGMAKPRLFYDLNYNYGTSPEDNFNLGDASPCSLTATINLGLLLDLYRLAKMKYLSTYNLTENQLVGKEYNKFFNYYIRQRNKLVLDFLDTAAHECRHLFQYGYANSKLEEDEKGIEIYKKLFDDNADAVVKNIYGDHHLEMPVVNITTFLLENGVVTCGKEFSLQEYTTEELMHIVYLKQKYEKDAREYSLGKMFEFKNDVADELKLERTKLANRIPLFGSVKSQNPYRLANLKMVNKKVGKYYSFCLDRELYADQEGELIDVWVKSVQENIQHCDLVAYLLHKANKDGLICAMKELEQILRYDMLPILFDSEDKLVRLKAMLYSSGLEDCVNVIEKWQWKNESIDEIEEENE